MNAYEANARSRAGIESQRNKAVYAWTKRIRKDVLSKIEEATQRGEFSIHYPVPKYWENDQFVTVVREYLESMRYLVRPHLKDDGRLVISWRTTKRGK